MRTAFFDVAEERGATAGRRVWKRAQVESNYGLAEEGMSTAKPLQQTTIGSIEHGAQTNRSVIFSFITSGTG